MPGGSALVILHCRRVLYDAVQIRLLVFVYHYAYPVRPFVVSMQKNKNNDDKFYCRKSMRAADEKLIINKLGPYHFSTMHTVSHEFLTKPEESVECRIVVT